MIGTGSFSKEGGRGGLGGSPVLEKALDLRMISARATIPLLVPRITGRAMYLDTFVRILWCWAYLGQSLSMWLYVSVVLMSGRKDC